MCDALAVLLVAQVNAVGVSVAAPTQRDAQAVQTTLELICMTASRGSCGCGEKDVIKLREGHCLETLPALIKSGHTALSRDNAQHQKTLKTKTNELFVGNLDGNKS